VFKDLPQGRFAVLVDEQGAEFALFKLCGSFFDARRRNRCARSQPS
jgi:hypothetical protein